MAELDVQPKGAGIGVYGSTDSTGSAGLNKTLPLNIGVDKPRSHWFFRCFTPTRCG